MCGIAGVVLLERGLDPPSVEQLRRMTGSLGHRGPDEFGLYRDRRVGLCHARLSIIDLATGQQPLSNEDGTIWIAFNGEIFNYPELRDELIKAGHAFRTRSDTEVIVHAWEAWGPACFGRFNGQWAVALWDSPSGRLVLARDPYGVRPLHVCEHRGRLYFGSEIKAIFAADPAIPREFDPAGLDEALTFWCTVAPRTVFKGVSELTPGTVRVIDLNDGTISESRSWLPTYPEDGRGEFVGTVESAAAATRDALEQATRLRMLLADVPVGAYLSGGLDSSMVAALGLRAKGNSFHTFSLRFEDSEYDETEYQRLMAAHLGSDHHEVLVSRGDIARVFPDVVAHAERPLLRTAPAPLFLLSRLVRDAGIKVVLTGEGADELFAGYDLFREAKVRRFWARQASSECRPLLLERLYPYLGRSPVAQRAMTRQFFGQNLAEWRSPGFGHDLRWRGTSALKRLLSPACRHAIPEGSAVRALVESLPEGFPRWSPLAQDQYLEIRTLLSGYLLSSQGDRMLMANSVEGRFPFLDRRVAALADSLPARYKLSGLDEKHVLKLASSELIPQPIVCRKKQPYRAPDALTFAVNAPDWVHEVTSDRALADAGVFSPTAARQVLNKCIDRGETAQFSNADNMAIIAILSVQLLHDRLIIRQPSTAVVPLHQTIIDRVELDDSDLRGQSQA